MFRCPIPPVLLIGCLLATACASAPPHSNHPFITAASVSDKVPSVAAITGIASCDDYLARYVACYRVAAIYPPNQLEGRYQTMRDSLLQQSREPNVRPLLGSRCVTLTRQLERLLHDKSCGDTP